MAIFYPDILQQRTGAREFSYGDKDVMLYALGVGMGRDPMDETELAFVYEKSLKVIPTAATVLASGLRGRAGPAPEMPAGHRPSQINFLMVVHGEQKVELHKPLPTSGTFTAQGRTVGAFDKGKDKGAVIVNETIWTDEKGEKVATLTGSTFARGDGGFGGPSEGQPEPHQIPSRKADLSVDISTREDQALLYRLNGDRNPLHSDPEFAAAAGFPRPILHGLCSYGMTCKALVDALLDADVAAVGSYGARFTGVAYPGETLKASVWKEDGRLLATVIAPSRENAAVLTGVELIPV